MMDNLFDVIIIGSGPAGLTAGIYTSRADLKTLIIAGSKWGGQLMQTTLVENYPGFPDGIQGPELMANMRKQAENMGATIIEEDAETLNTLKTQKFAVKAGEREYEARAVIVASGAEFNWLGLPSEQKLIGRGVSSCATCDAAFFRNKKVIVVGGGDAAMEEALVLAKFASEVTVVHRRDSFRASKVMQERVLNHPKIKVMWNTTVTEVVGENKVEGVMLKTQDALKTLNTLNTQNMPIDGVFVAIGHSPATQIFKGKVELDGKGYVLPHPKSLSTIVEKDLSIYKMMTSVEGVFTAGDVHDVNYKQAITAAGFGCQAALEVEKWLSDIKS